MVSKTRSMYVCQQCGGEFPKWSGQCGNCGQWGTLVETVVSTQSSKSKFQISKFSGRVYKFSEVDASKINRDRLEVGSGELSQVLGGGLVPGSVILLAGEPGIGKSTLLSQMTLYFAAKHGKVLYVCGEESVEQVKLRLDRISVHKKTSQSAKENILLFPETETDNIVAAMEQEKPVLTIIDSIQTLVVGELSGMAGSVGQVRESGNRIMRSAKGLGLSTFIVGHVTKGGSIAGPKVLEHMVDAVLQLTGERSGRLRLLRAMKNRFGAVDEVGVYEMTEAGLAEVTDPSGIFLEGLKQGVPGSCVTVVMEGTRPMCAEIQALVVPSNIPTPRRVVEGVKKSRVEVLCAVLQKRAGIKLYDKDVFINVTGGLKINEPAADLAICLAIASSVKDQGLPKDVAAFGEVGLLGEVRNVFYGDRREKEAKKMGYERYVSSKTGREVGGLIKQMVGKGEE